MRYIIDRIEEYLVVCEKEDGSRVFFYPEDLPEGAAEGDILVETEQGSYIDREATAIRRQEIREKLEKLMK